MCVSTSFLKSPRFLYWSRQVPLKEKKYLYSLRLLSSIHHTHAVLSSLNDQCSMTFGVLFVVRLSLCPTDFVESSSPDEGQRLILQMTLPLTEKKTPALSITANWHRSAESAKGIYCADGFAFSDLSRRAPF